MEAAVAARSPGVGASRLPFVCGFEPVNCPLRLGVGLGEFVGSVGNLTTPRAGRSRARLKEAQMRIKPANFILLPFYGLDVWM